MSEKPNLASCGKPEGHASHTYTTERGKIKVCDGVAYKSKK